MNCECIQGNYNFYVEALDKDTILYQDLSNWMNEDGYGTPDQYTINIIPPATSKTYSVVINTGQLNRLTSNEIGTLKDGIYCFKVTSCGQDYTRSKAIFPKLECCISQLWAISDSNKYDQINEIENHLNLIKVNAELNNIQLAQSELKITKKLLENLNCDCGC